MKEWCLKHPIMTFLLIDEAIVCFANIFTNRSRRSFVNRLANDVEEGVNEIRDYVEERREETEKRPIGFAV